MKILCPVDFSPASKHALGAAVAIAMQTGAELVLLHAWFLPIAYAGELGYPADATAGMIGDAEALLKTDVAWAKEHGVPHVTSLLLGGPPSPAMVTILEEDRAFELVVMGTNGRTGLSRLVLGSVAAQTIRHAPCSVLAIHPSDPMPTFRSILCPLDFSDSAQVGLDLALRLVQPGGRGLELLHVIELPVAYSGTPSVDEFARDLYTSVLVRLEQTATATRERTSVAVTIDTQTGAPGAALVAAIAARVPPFDIAILGSHGRTGLRRFALGSVAEKVVRHATCPVLIARQRSA